MDSSPVSENRLHGQAIFFYALVILWPLYLFVLPAVFSHYWYLGILFMIFPGLYLFTWVGYLMHESWHRYMPNLNDRFFYNVFAYMLPSDPQLYNIVHGSHHGQVNSYEDAEFHPFGEIKNRPLRILYNWLEFIFGVAFLVVAGSLSVPRDPRFTRRYHLWKLPLSLMLIAMFYIVLGFLCHQAFGLTAAHVIIPYLINLWFDSFFLHQSQLIEHGNLLMDGPVKERNLYTRNLKPAGLVERVFLFFTHNDSLEHVLHHTLTPYYVRPFSGEYPMPKEAVYITFKDYLKILRGMLDGQEQVINLPLKQSTPHDPTIS